MSDLDLMSEEELERACKLWSGYPGCAARMARAALRDRKALLAIAQQYASECGECGGTGTTERKAWPGGIEVDYEAPCEDCADIRAVIAKATAP